MTKAADTKRLITIEGLPGSGHSEFAQWAADQSDWFAEMESGQGVLPAIERSALSHVLQRLISRYEAQQSLVSEDLFRRHVVSDFTFETHVLWAECLLSQQDRLLYNRVTSVMTPVPIRPDLMVYMQAPDAQILRALGEAHPSVDLEHWATLAQAYDNHFFGYNDTPLLVVRRAEDATFHGIGSREDLWDKILSYQGGKTYFMGESGLWDGGSPAGD